MDIKQYTYDLKQIDAVATDILLHLKHKIVLFNGEMGAGKTTLIKAMLKAMQSDEAVTSPTFSIVNEYKIPNDKVYHFDFYRIETIEEAYNFGIEDYLNSNHWLFIEWPQKIEEILPDNVSVINVSINNPTKRTLKLNINSNKLTKNKAHRQET